MRLRLLLALAAVLNASLASAGTPREDFESEGALRAASLEIRSLDQDQLEAVIDYIASCNPAPAAERDYTCERSIERFRIKVAKEPALQAIRQSVSIVDRLIPWNSASGAKGAKDIERRVAIFQALSSAAASRYHELKAK